MASAGKYFRGDRRSRSFAASSARVGHLWFRREAQAQKPTDGVFRQRRHTNNGPWDSCELGHGSERLEESARQELSVQYTFGNKRIAHSAKRIFDCVCALCAIVIVAPLLAIIALLIKMSSSGPVLYRGARVGRGGKVFRMLKFRTMVVDAEKRGGSATSADDPRITRIGHLLRKSKLDELPQLINVLRGEMSLVGPRSDVVKYADMYSEEERVIL